MDDFLADLKDGKRGERIIAEALTARGNKVIDMSEDVEYQYKDIDFIVSKEDQSTTLEVKSDAASVYTGNLFIEIHNDNNKSHSYKGWFFYCEAEYICFLQEHNRKAYIVAFDEMRQHIKNNIYRTANSSNASGILLPVAALSQMQSYKCLEI